MAQVTHRGNTGHASAALQRVQVPLQFLHGSLVLLVFAPTDQSLVRRLQQFSRLFRENRSDLGVVSGFILDFRLSLRGRFGRGGCSRLQIILWLHRVGEIVQMIN